MEMEPGHKKGRIQSPLLNAVQTIGSHDLARHLHGDNNYFLLDCRPVLAYNSCHISGAVNVNFTGMIKKRFIAGKIGLPDLFSQEAKEKFKNCLDWPTVVYDDCTAELRGLPSSTTILLVLSALEKMGKCPYLLQGYREQALDWQTAPPVHVLSYLVLGSEKDAKCWEVICDFKIKYILNVTPKCPNHFEKESMVYKRIAVADTGSQKLSVHFFDAFKFIEEARQANTNVLIHCMAGISRSVTLTIAYLMYHFGLSMHVAYQFVKEKRPAISPNLNFMGQLVEFEKELVSLHSERETIDINQFLPTLEQETLSKNIQGIASSSGSSAESTPEASKATGSSPFILKLPAPRHMKGRNKKLSPAIQGVQEVGEYEMANELAGTGAVASGGDTNRRGDMKLELQRSAITECQGKELLDYKSRELAKSKDVDVEVSKHLKISDSVNVSPVLRHLESEPMVEAVVQSFEKLSRNSSDSSSPH